MQIQKVLNDLKEEYGVQYIADCLGCSKPAVYSWCCGRRLPASKFIPQIAKLANLSVDTLLNKSNADLTNLKQHEDDFTYLLQTLDKLLGKYGLTKLSKKLRCSRSAIYSWQQKRTLPNIVYVKRIAELTGISADILLGQNGAPLQTNRKLTPIYSLDDIDKSNPAPINTTELSASIASEYPNSKFYQVTTDSINKYAPCGSIVLIDHAHNKCNGLVIAKVKGNITVGVCYHGNSQVLIIPATYEQSAQDIVTSISDVEVLGQIVFYMGCVSL